MATSVPPIQPGNPGGPSIVVMPNTGAPVKSAVEQASDAARAAIASAGTALPPEVVQRPGDPARVAAGQPAGGQFAPSLTKELPAGAAPAAGQPPGTAPAPGTQGAPAIDPNETPEAKLAREAAAAVAETPEQKTAREAEEALAVELPIMVGEGDAAVPLVMYADTPENAAALQQLVSDAVSGRESAIVIENAQRQLEQADDMRVYAGADPVGFTIDMLGQNIEHGEVLAKFLLTQPSLFERLKPTLTKMLANPAELGNIANEVKAKRSDLERTANATIAEDRAVRANVREVQSTVMSMIPADMPEAQRKVAFRDMLRDLKDYADSNQLMTLPVHQIPSLLTDRLSALGIDPEAAASAAAVAAARKSGGSHTSGRPAVPAAARRTPLAAPVRAPAPKPNGKAFVSSAARKAELAAVPPGGAGSPGGGSALNAPPRKADGSPMNMEETIAWHRGEVAKGNRHY